MRSYKPQDRSMFQQRWFHRSSQREIVSGSLFCGLSTLSISPLTLSKSTILSTAFRPAWQAIRARFEYRFENRKLWWKRSFPARQPPHQMGFLVPTVLFTHVPSSRGSEQAANPRGRPTLSCCRTVNERRKWSVERWCEMHWNRYAVSKQTASTDTSTHGLIFPGTPKTLSRITRGDAGLLPSRRFLLARTGKGKNSR